MKILVPTSGGKDSAACLVMAINKYGKENVVSVFNDTGWEHPLTYEYLDYLEGRLGISIHRTIGGDRRNGDKAQTLPELIIAQGRFPFGRGRFCTTHLKQYALRDYYKNHIYNEDVQYEFWFGMRQEESVQRGKKYAGMVPEDLFDMDDLFPSRYNKKLRATIKVRLPIIDWSKEAVFKYLKDSDVEYNKLYDEGTNDRVGCYPCMLAGKKAQEKMLNTEFGKQRLIQIKELEEITGTKYEMFDTDQGSCELCKI